MFHEDAHTDSIGDPVDVENDNNENDDNDNNNNRDNDLLTV